MMLLFTARLKLAEKYDQWRKENHVLDCPLSVVTFLLSMGLLDEDKCREYLKEIKS